MIIMGETCLTTSSRTFQGQMCCLQSGIACCGCVHPDTQTFSSVSVFIMEVEAVMRFIVVVVTKTLPVNVIGWLLLLEGTEYYYI